jgi:hypothetical protein
MPIQSSFLPNTYLLLSIAKSSLSRASNDAQESLVAIMFSCAALESFINESYEPIRYLRRDDILPGLIEYATMMQEMVSIREPLKCKYHKALSHFTGTSQHKGAQPYQDFKILVDIRNSVMHNKPDTFTRKFNAEEQPPQKQIEDHPKFIRQLKSNKAIEETDFHCNWIDLVMNDKVAQWAFSTANKMIDTLISSVPPGKFCTDLRSIVTNAG